MKKLLIAATVACCAMTSPASAHPGHGHHGASDSLLHYLTEPVHVVTGVGLIAVSLLAIGWAARLMSRRDHANAQVLDDMVS